MKKTDKRWIIRLGAAALSAALLGTAAALATGGDQTDPLITLSYLNQTAIPQIVRQVEDKAELRQKELEQVFASQINQYRQQGGQNSGTVSAGSASFTLVTLRSGQTMSLGVGCELLPRIGNVTVQSNTAPALIDLSAGGTVNSGTALTRNHLYMATIADRTLTASGGEAKLLVRGSCSIA